MPVLLFDIDGTLVRSGGAGKAAMEKALQIAFGIPEINSKVPYSGRTDLAIGRDLLIAHEIDHTLENQHLLRRTYLDQLPHHLSVVHGSVCPGIETILQKCLKSEEIVLGLLTGNVREGAQKKLGHYGLWDYFPHGGGFGDNHYDRNDVARSAVHEIETRLNRKVPPSEVWVIGDTPLDVSCARSIGANVVAVATGIHTVDELKPSNPDHLYHDLGDCPELLRIWGIH